ncbi:MAG: hypothetical protein KAJ31_06450 [Deltaproteobacteria bacterium]|nr:hypothetical protein [Deltaproteobacteria bacterium]
MADEFDHLACPNCGSELVYSDGTHDLGCKNNPKPFEETNKKRERKLHEQPASYGSENEKNNTMGYSAEGSDKEEGANKSNSSKLCDTKKHNKVLSVCELSRDVESSKSCHTDGEQLGLCVFGVSFTESANKGTLWSIRAVHGDTNYAALMRLLQNIEERIRNNKPLAANVPNLPKKIERNKVSKLAFRYSLETETLERLAMFYNLTEKEIRHIKQSDVMEE